MTADESTPKAARVGRNAMITAAAGLGVRVSGLAREIVFAGVFGAGMATDAYNAAFRAAQFFRELLAEGSLANAYVPIFADVSQRDGLRAAFRLANAFLGILLLVLGVVTVVTFAFAEGWVWLIAAGFAEDPDKFALSAHLTRILSPFLATVSLASLAMGMLNVRGRFFLPALAPASFNVAVIAGCLLAKPFEAWTGQPAIVAVGIASLAGGLGQFVVQLPALYREGFRIRPRLERHPALLRLFKFFVPAFVGITTVQFNLLVESQLASRFGDGPVSYLLYAFRLVQLPNTVVAASVGTAALAGLSTLAARGRKQELLGALREAITLNSFLVFPAAVGLFLLAEPIVRLMYERGAFTPEDTAATAAMLRMYAIAIWGICFHRVALPSYYAIGRPYYPMIVAIGTMLAKLPVALFLVYTLDLSYVGLPLSHAVLVMVESAFLWWGYRSRVGRLPRRTYTDHLRIALATVAMGLVVWWLRPWAHGPMLVPVVGLAGVVYFGAGHLLGLEGPAQVLRRLRIGRPRGLPPSVDPQTRSALGELAAGRLGAAELEDHRVVVETDRGRFEIRARSGVLHVERIEVARAPAPPAPSGERVRVRAVMRVGQGPPALHGLWLGDRSFRAVADRVEEGVAPGPEIPVAAPERRESRRP